jgi:AcrR family transcriptional regulator
MDDAPGTKQLRTRAALHRAVLELAAERDPTALTVTEVAERAGVHRSTVYEHAASPMDLLQRALLAELDELRAAHLYGVAAADLPAAIEAVTLEVFRHVDRRAAIYRNVDAADGATLHALLAGHFAESSRLLLGAGVLEIPIDDGGLAREATVRYLADGVVGLIGAWLATPAPRDPHTALGLLRQLQPAWWPGAKQ